MTSGHRRLRHLSINLEYLSVFFSLSLSSLFLNLANLKPKHAASCQSHSPLFLLFPLLRKPFFTLPHSPTPMAWSQESATSKWGEETEEGRQHPFLYDTYQTFSKLCLSFSLSFSLYLFLSATSRMLFKNASCKNLPVLRPLVITKAFFFIVFYSLFLSLPAPAPSS